MTDRYFSDEQIRKAAESLGLGSIASGRTREKGSDFGNGGGSRQDMGQSAKNTSADSKVGWVDLGAKYVRLGKPQTGTGNPQPVKPHWVGHGR